MALDVYLTNACNLRCTYCFNLDREDAPRIPLDDIRSILEAAYQRGDRYVSITGGEPFIYKEIFDVLDFAHDLGYWINILSHGGLLNQERIDHLKKYWRLRIRISLDGPNRETHDLARGLGTFDNTVSKIEMLVRSGVDVGIGVVVTERNLDRIEDLFQFCIDKHVTFVRFSPVARIKKGKSQRVTAELHERLIESLIRLSIKYQDHLDLPQPVRERVPASIDVLTTRRCMAGKHFFGITPDKKIVPCPLIADHPDVSSVYYNSAESFDQLGDEMDKLFEKIQDRLEGICGSCEFRKVCYGGCLAEKISFERGLHEEQPICTKLILERLRPQFDANQFDRIVKSWVWQLQNSLESTNGHACMRQAPYWNVNLKAGEHWSQSSLRFN